MATPDSGSNTTPGLTSALNRRSFLGLLGAGAGVVALAGCKKDDSDEDNRPALDLGSGQTGLLRFAYSMEGLILEFYKEAISVRLPAESALKDQLVKMQNFHQAYSDLLKTWLDGDVPSPLLFDTSKMNLRDRVRMAANGFYLLDVASSSYNGLAERISDPARSLVMAKIAASCARQSTYFRWNQTSTFWDIRASSDIINPGTGLTSSRSPAQAANALDAFLIYKWNTDNLA